MATITGPASKDSWEDDLRSVFKVYDRAQEILDAPIITATGSPGLQDHLQSLSHSGKPLLWHDFPSSTQPLHWQIPKTTNLPSRSFQASPFTSYCHSTSFSLFPLKLQLCNSGYQNILLTTPPYRSHSQSPDSQFGSASLYLSIVQSSEVLTDTYLQLIPYFQLTTSNFSPPLAKWRLWHSGHTHPMEKVPLKFSLLDPKANPQSSLYVSY
jgi:hypothetical protein